MIHGLGFCQKRGEMTLRERGIPGPRHSTTPDAAARSWMPPGHRAACSSQDHGVEQRPGPGSRKGHTRDTAAAPINICSIRSPKASMMSPKKVTGSGSGSLLGPGGMQEAQSPTSVRVDALVRVCVCVCVCVTPKSFKSCSNCEVQHLRRTAKRPNHEFKCTCAPSSGVRQLG